MAHRRKDQQTFKNSQRLRENPTEAEERLWSVLRLRQVDEIHFRRQHAIGPYIVDFCAPRYKIIIEVDGSQHLDQQEYDAERSAYLESKGYRVLRFWNEEVINNLNEVIRAIFILIDLHRDQKG